MDVCSGDEGYGEKYRAGDERFHSVAILNTVVRQIPQSSTRSSEPEKKPRKG